jgi:hypothetical protein
MSPSDQHEHEAPAISRGTLIGAVIGAAVGFGVEVALGLPGLAETIHLAPALAIGSLGAVAGGYTGAVMGTRSAPASSPADEQQTGAATQPLVGLELRSDVPEVSRRFRDRVTRSSQTAGTDVPRRR